VGNNVTVEIGRKNQKIDFPLERPAQRKTEPASGGTPPKK
jgi:hypothetical protein